MTSEELFLAIGMLENDRLERSESQKQDPSQGLEGPTMKKQKRNVRRIVRNLLAAVLILGMLGVTAYAAAAYLIFDGPEEMVGTLFGDKTGYDHSAGSITTFEDGIGSIVEPTFDRVPVEESLAQEVAPLVSPVGQTISGNGYTLRVDGNLYDAVTKCGVVTYTLENSEGLDYSVQSDGEVWFPGGEVVRFSQYGYSYIIQDQSTDTKLTASYYYQIRSENTDLEIGLSHDDGKQDNEGACITIPAVTSGEMRSITLGKDAVTLSSVAMCMDIGKIANYPNEFIDVAKIQFADGTEYVVKDGYTENFVFNVGSEDGMEVTFMFNRIIDVGEVTGIILDGGLELKVD